VLAASGVTACSDDGKDAGGRSSAVAPNSDTPASRSPQGQSKAIVIKTHVIDFDGTVLAGSVIGDSPFCAGGKVHHAFGSPDIGFPAVNVFTCGKSQLKIGFGPGPDQMNNRIQTSGWKTLGGTGEFAGVTGSGQMKVEFPAAGSSDGREIFTGSLVLP
jgi:hypothetical protein